MFGVQKDTKVEYKGVFQLGTQADKKRLTRLDRVLFQRMRPEPLCQWVKITLINTSKNKN